MITSADRIWALPWLYKSLSTERVRVHRQQKTVDEALMCPQKWLECASTAQTSCRARGPPFLVVSCSQYMDFVELGIWIFLHKFAWNPRILHIQVGSDVVSHGNTENKRKWYNNAHSWCLPGWGAVILCCRACVIHSKTYRVHTG